MYTDNNSGALTDAGPLLLLPFMKSLIAKVKVCSIIKFSSNEFFQTCINWSRYFKIVSIHFVANAGELLDCFLPEFSMELRT